MGGSLALVGEPQDVPLVGGGSARHLNFDFAASAPALVEVDRCVKEFLPWYSSVHRGAGFKSMVATAAYEQARRDVAAFVGAREDDVTIFTRNSTDALNLLASCLEPRCRVVTFEGEHHANLLPWRRFEVTTLPLPDDASLLAGMLDEALGGLGEGPPVLFAVTAASNVTGEIWPVVELTEVARRHGARVVVDAAQLAPHGPVSLADWDADWVVFSGHKLYAPWGAGAIVGRPDWLRAREPFLVGGGAVAFVAHDEVLWSVLPDRQEAGSPNVVGAVAMGAACRTLRAHGMDRILAHEADIDRQLAEGLDTVPGLRRHNLWGDDHPRIAVQTFSLPGLHHSLLATALSAEHGIAVRDGCFCAHPLMLRLLKVPDEEAALIRDEARRGIRHRMPGAVRASAGLATTTADVQRLVEAVTKLAHDGPSWTYRRSEVTGHHAPDPDDRPMPTLACIPGPPMPGAEVC